MSDEVDFTRGERLDDAQRQQLCDLLFNALLRIRMLGWQGDVAQVASLADALHNLPALLYSDRFNWELARRYLADHVRAYPEGADLLTRFDNIPRAR